MAENTPLLVERRKGKEREACGEKRGGMENEGVISKNEEKA
jgi:hypothetical protein